MADRSSLVDTYPLYIDGPMDRATQRPLRRHLAVHRTDDRAGARGRPRRRRRRDRCRAQGLRRRTVGRRHTRGARPVPRSAGQRAVGTRRRLLRAVPGRMGLHRQRAADSGRRSRLHGPARRRTGRAVGRRTDRRVRGGGYHAASSRATRRRIGAHAVELPAQPQRDEGVQCAGGGQHRRSQAVTADTARRPCAGPNHRPAHRHSAWRGQRRHPERHRRQQDARPPIRVSTWSASPAAPPSAGK